MWVWALLIALPLQQANPVRDLSETELAKPRRPGLGGAGQQQQDDGRADHGADHGRVWQRRNAPNRLARGWVVVVRLPPMGRAFTAAICLLAGIAGASAQDQGFSADLGGVSQKDIPGEVYTQILFHHLGYNTFPPGSVVIAEDEFAFVAPRAGIVRFSGQVYGGTGPAMPMPDHPPWYVVKIEKNGRGCTGDDVFAAIGNPTGIWWLSSAQISAEDMAAAGDTYRWCISATAGADKTVFVDGNPAHTVIYVSMSAP